MSVKESNFNEKKRSKFSRLLTARAEVADPPSAFFVTPHLGEGVKKEDILQSGRPQAFTPLPLFVNFFDVFFFFLDYDHMCYELDFTQGKSHFHPTTKISNSSLSLISIRGNF